MASSQQNYQSTAQSAQVQPSNNANTAEDTTNGQWTNNHTQSQFTEVNRAVPTVKSNAQAQTQKSHTSSSTTNTDSMTPMERWIAETPGQAPWNAIKSVSNLSNNTGSGYSNNHVNDQQQSGDDWSTCANKSTW
ncbi:hypothetical protein EAE96_007292 [Botrytis aclada]|nr:hypothetical protein EAE96_007292 [Botrytis aclada]